jgi:hypothetical protein
MLRLADCDLDGVINRSYWCEAGDPVRPETIHAPEAWAVEGVHYAQRRAELEQAAAAERARKQALEAHPQRAELLQLLRAASADEIAAYVDAQALDLAGARALLKRILLVLSAGGDK